MPVTQLLVFAIGDRRVALFAAGVREIVRAVAISRLPKAPPIVEGIINVRGTIVPVLDVRARFSIPPRELTPDQHMIVANSGRRLVALLVDHVIDLISIDEAHINTTQSAPGAEYVAGVATLPDGLLVIHDLTTFLSLGEAAQLDAASAERGGVT